MTLLPIVERELRVAARRPATYWLRTGFGAVAILLGVFIWATARGVPSSQFGAILFSIFASLSVVVCLAAGLRMTADCLSEEKREGTLGLLFLTDLKAYDILLGKLAASSVGGVYGILAIFPIMAVPLLMGGVTAGDFWRVMLLLVNTTLLSLSVGLAVSSLSRSAYKAIAATLVILLVLAAGFPLLSVLMNILVPSAGKLQDALLLPCPFYALGKAFGSVGRRWTLSPYVHSSTLLHLLTWMFMGVAWLVVPRTWQDRPTASRMERFRAAWHRLAFGPVERRHGFRTRLLERNPICWLGARARLKSQMVWVVIAAIACLWGVGNAFAGEEWFCEAVYLPTAILLNSLLKTWVALEAGRNLAEDRRSGALELILSTPLTVKEILRGQWMALRTQFLGPCLTVIAIQVIFLAASLQRESFHDQPINPVLWITFILLLLGDTIAAGWVGLWSALLARKPRNVPFMTFTRILAAPWVLWIMVMLATAVWMEHAGYRSPGAQSLMTWKFFVGLWFGLGVLLDLAFGLGAAIHVRTRFRALALRHYGSATPAWRRWFRGKGSPARA